MGRENLKYLFEPETIAMIGASNNFAKWGFIILHNLVMGKYQGKIYPVNPKEKEILGHPCYPSVKDIPGEVDQAMLLIPAREVPKAVAECAEKKVKAIVVISAGFSELGEEGERLQKQMTETAMRAGIPLVGPNGQGVAFPKSQFYPWMPLYFPKPGKVAILSQSGNLLTWLAEGLEIFGFGISRGVSVGNMADLDWADYLWYLADDPETKVILLYIEGVRDGRAFREAASEVSLKKPIVALKAGRTNAGVQAAKSHTGAMKGEDLIFSALCEQTGMIRVRSMEEAVMVSAGLVATPSPKGKRVGILTGGGGLGVMAADECLEQDLEVPALSPQTSSELGLILPPWWAPGNPVDLVAGIGYAGPKEVIPILIDSQDFDSLILIGLGWVHGMPDLSKLSPLASKFDFQKMTEDRKTGDLKYCRKIRDLIQKNNYPIILVSTHARRAIDKNFGSLIELLLNEVMLYPSIESAVRFLSLFTKYQQWKSGRKNELGSDLDF